MSGDRQPQVRFDESRVSAGCMLAILAAILVSAFLIHGGLLTFEAFLMDRRSRDKRVPESLAGEPPRPGIEAPLQVDPHRDLMNYLDQQHRLLGTYGWIDRGSGVVHIPVLEAKRIVLSRGLPSAGPAPANRPSPANAPAVPAAIDRPPLPARRTLP